MNGNPSKLQQFLSNLIETDRNIAQIFNHMYLPISVLLSSKFTSTTESDPNSSSTTEKPNIQQALSLINSPDYRSKLFFKMMNSVGLITNTSLSSLPTSSLSSKPIINIINWYKFFVVHKFEFILHFSISTISNNKENQEEMITGSPYSSVVDAVHSISKQAGSQIDQTCSKWATYSLEGIYVKLVTDEEDSIHNSSENEDKKESSSESNPIFGANKFCVVSVKWETSNLAAIHFGFFHIQNVKIRKAIISSLIQLLQHSSSSQLFTITSTSDSTFTDLSKLTLSVKPTLLANLLFSSTDEEISLYQNKHIRRQLITYDTAKGHTSSNRFELSELPRRPQNILLSSFLKSRRWGWRVENSTTRNEVIETIVKTRIKEGYIIVNESRFYSFVKTIELNTCKFGTYSSKCVIQYIVYLCHPNLIVSEFWMDPITGTSDTLGDNESLAPMKDSELFNYFSSNIKEIDEYIVSAFSTFDTLLSILSSSNTSQPEELDTTTDMENEEFLSVIFVYDSLLT